MLVAKCADPNSWFNDWFCAGTDAWMLVLHYADDIPGTELSKLVNVMLLDLSGNKLTGATSVFSCSFFSRFLNILLHTTLFALMVAFIFILILNYCWYMLYRQDPCRPRNDAKLDGAQFEWRQLGWKIIWQACNLNHQWVGIFNQSTTRYVITVTVFGRLCRHCCWW